MNLEKQIIDAVRVHPGITYYRLSILLNVHEIDVQRVMDVLASERRLRCEPKSSSLRWYLPNAPAVPYSRHGDISPGTRAWEALVITAERRGGITFADLVAITPMNSTYVHRVMRRLKDAGLVVVKSNGDARWGVTPTGRKRLAEERRREVRARARRP